MSIERSLPYPSVLERFSSSTLQDASLPAASAEWDGLVSNFLDQATDWKNVASMMAGGLAYRLGKAGGFALFSAAPLRSLAAAGMGLAAEATVISGFPSGHHAGTSAEVGWARTFLNMGLLHATGTFASHQNIFVGHFLQDAGVVAGENLVAHLRGTPAPEGDLIRQFARAEVMNQQAAWGMAFARHLLPGISNLERNGEMQAFRSEQRIAPRTPIARAASLSRNSSRSLLTRALPLFAGLVTFFHSEFASATTRVPDLMGGQTPHWVGGLTLLGAGAWVARRKKGDNRASNSSSDTSPNSAQGRQFHPPVVIVGGGPAGAATAIGLANFLRENSVSGLSPEHIFLLEAGHRPTHDKACGGFITRHGLKGLERLQVATSAFPHSPIHRIALTHMGEMPSFGDPRFLFEQRLRRQLVLEYPDFGLVTRRLDLDEALRREAERRGVRVLGDTQVREILPPAPGASSVFRVRAHDAANGEDLEFLTPILVGADGAAGISRKTALRLMGLSVRPEDYYTAIAWRANVPVERLPADFRVPHDQVDLNFIDLRTPQGSDITYDWRFSGATAPREDFPSGRLWNVGLGHFGSKKRFTANTRQMMAGTFPDLADVLAARNGTGEAVSPVHGGLIPFFNTEVPPVLFGENFGADRSALLLVGDAMGLASSLSGEGIGQSLLMGHGAAQAIGRAWANPEQTRGRLQRYADEARRWSSVSLHGRVANAVSRRIYRPEPFAEFYRILERNPLSLGRAAADLITGEFPSFFQPPFARIVPELGIRLLAAWARERRG